MRALLQRHRLTHLGQCDPFDATVDAAIFVGRKRGPGVPPVAEIDAAEFDAKFDAGDISEYLDISTARVAEPGVLGESPYRENSLLFIQARPRTGTEPDVALDTLPPRDAVLFSESTETVFGEVAHGIHSRPGRMGADLRVHRVPLALYRATHKRAFFEPRPGTLRLWGKFNAPVKALVGEWWERIKDSKAFDKNRDEITAYQRTLKPGDITLVGLIAEGGQLEKLHKARTVSDEEFIALCRETQRWADGPPGGKRRAPREALGLRSCEDYTHADDAPRIATIYNGLAGRAQFVPFRKGDPDGNR